MAVRMQQKHGTAAQWSATNPVLGDGEIGFVKDTNIIKFGDGVTAWNNLPGFTVSKANDSDKLDGLDSTQFLRSDAKAVDADKLDGYNSSTTYTASTVPVRDAAGQMPVPPTPTASTHASSKSYVDSQITANKPHLEAKLSGTVTVAANGTVGTAQTVTWTAPFVATPIVVATPNAQATRTDIIFFIASRSTTSASVNYVQSGTTSTSTVHPAANIIAMEAT